MYKKSILIMNHRLYYLYLEASRWMSTLGDDETWSNISQCGSPSNWVASDVISGLKRSFSRSAGMCDLCDYEGMR